MCSVLMCFSAFYPPNAAKIYFSVLNKNKKNKSLFTQNSLINGPLSAVVKSFRELFSRRYLRIRCFRDGAAVWWHVQCVDTLPNIVNIAQRVYAQFIVHASQSVCKSLSEYRLK